MSIFLIGWQLKKLHVRGAFLTISDQMTQLSASSPDMYKTKSRNKLYEMS